MSLDLEMPETVREMGKPAERLMRCFNANHAAEISPDCTQMHHPWKESFESF